MCVALLHACRTDGQNILTVACTVLGIGIYVIPPAPERNFPIDFKDGTIVYPEFAYPMRKEIGMQLLSLSLWTERIASSNL